MVSALHVSGIIPYFRFTAFTASVLYLAFKTSTFRRIVFAKWKSGSCSDKTGIWDHAQITSKSTLDLLRHKKYVSKAIFIYFLLRAPKRESIIFHYAIQCLIILPYVFIFEISVHVRLWRFHSLSWNLMLWLNHSERNTTVKTKTKNRSKMRSKVFQELVALIWIRLLRI